ncbi:GvpL/GvpF family gas vesicle protein [Archangium sp.]|jgi:hypothetical protein|uniref:GvpL/GvpF family gas vesicle protein n=1 Tax=Archangium sp. TaxID=1872627 RepID=UPI002ED91E77
MAELLLYGIVDAASALPGDGRGVHGGGLRRIVHGELAAVVSPLAEPARAATPARAELLDYERVIRSLHAVANVLPMRFGGVLPDEAAVREHLDAQRTVYSRALTRIAGCVEMGVRALVSAPPPSAAPAESALESRSGADYLKARQRRHAAENQLRDRCAALEQALLAKVAPLCREHRSELSPARSGEPMLCSLYFLVPREQMAAFRAALSPIPDVGPAELTLSGPWPPFNFVA